MTILQFAETVLRVPLTCYQRELLVLLNNNRDGYLHHMKAKTAGLRMVKDVYERYHKYLSTQVSI